MAGQDDPEHRKKLRQGRQSSPSNAVQGVWMTDGDRIWRHDQGNGVFSAPAAAGCKHWTASPGPAPSAVDPASGKL
jgi:hypothetical protein